MGSTIYNPNKFGGKEVLEYITSRDPILKVYQLASTPDNSIHKYRFAMLMKFRGCTMYDLVDALLERSGKLANIMKLGGELDADSEDDRNKQVIFKLSTHISVPLGDVVGDLYANLVKEVSSKVRMQIDPHSAMAYMGKGNNIYDSLSLSYLEWLKYFSGFTDKEVHKRII